MLECAGCRAPNPSGTVFCVACARPLAATPPVATVAQAVRLVALENLQPTGRVFELPDSGYEGTLTLGRNDLAGGVVVDLDFSAAGGLEKGVSRRHATLAYASGLVRVMDWQSAHGTYVNKQRLAAGQEALLADGDELRLAGYVMRFEMRQAQGG